MSLCADMCHKRRFFNVCCDNNGWGHNCAPESTSVCVSNAASDADTSCTRSSAIQDCTNVLSAIPDATFSSSNYRNFEIEYMSGTQLFLINDYLDFFENTHSSVCKPMYCKFREEPDATDTSIYGLRYW